MGRHVTSAELLAFAEGSDDAAMAEVQAHLQDCEACRQRFDEQCGVDAALAPGMPPQLREQLHRGSERALVAAPHRRRWLLPVAVAAALLVGCLLLLRRSDELVAVVHRDRVSSTMRSGDEERLHLEVTVPQSGWLAVFARTAKGEVQRLLPHQDPTLGWLGVGQPLPTGKPVRVPGADLFDFAVEPASPPCELVLVLSAAAFDEAELVRLAKELQAAPVGEIAAPVRLRHPRSVLSAVPAR